MLLRTLREQLAWCKEALHVETGVRRTGQPGTKGLWHGAMREEQRMYSELYRAYNSGQDMQKGRVHPKGLTLNLDSGNNPQTV